MADKAKGIRQFHIALTADDNPALVEHMAGLAKRKELTNEIKLSIELLAQLRNGNRELLDTLFPGLCDPTPPPPPPAPSNEDLMREIISLKQALQQKPQPRDNSDIPDTRSHGIPAMKQAGQGISKLANRTIAMPIIEDEPDDGATIVLNKAAGVSNGNNLLSGIFGLG